MRLLVERGGELERRVEACVQARAAGEGSSVTVELQLLLDELSHVRDVARALVWEAEAAQIERVVARARRQLSYPAG